MPKIDLHTHSSASPDGGITAKQYKKILDSGKLDYIAVTDHNRVDFAIQLKNELGDKIIVGEEVMTKDGELIGLFLTKLVKPNMTAAQTTKAIHDQGGLVYLPHPFETSRKGLQKATLDTIASEIDIVEAYNGRAIIQNRTSLALAWARENGKPIFASSDAHGKPGIGHTYTTSTKIFNSSNFSAVLAEAHIVAARPPVLSLAYPKYHRFRQKLRREK
ncbi:MAG: PHP domain-containing protein [Candidatus Saccharimonadales bacterium]